MIDFTRHPYYLLEDLLVFMRTQQWDTISNWGNQCQPHPVAKKAFEQFVCEQLPYHAGANKSIEMTQHALKLCQQFELGVSDALILAAVRTEHLAVFEQVWDNYDDKTLIITPLLKALSLGPTRDLFGMIQLMVPDGNFDDVHRHMQSNRDPIFSNTVDNNINAFLAQRQRKVLCQQVDNNPACATQLPRKM